MISNDSVQRPEEQIERPSTTRAMSLLITPQSSSGNPLPASANGNPGWYRVTFVFAQPGSEVIGGKISVGEMLKSGYSQIKVAADHLRIYTGDPNLEDATVQAKIDGRVTHAEVRINGATFAVVESRSHALVSPILSFLSVMSGLPLAVSFIHILEEVTGSVQVAFTALGRGDMGTLKWDQMPDLNINAISGELLVAFSNFREGMNSFNPFYKLLSFYKVVDYCVAKSSQDRKSGRPMPPDAKIPTSMEGIDKDDTPFIAPYVGKKYTKVRDEFRDRLRNAIAHLSPDDSSLNPDDFEDKKRCSAAVPVLQLIARSMLLARYTLEANPPAGAKT
jgi:hypothetical protein